MSPFQRRVRIYTRENDAQRTLRDHVTTARYATHLQDRNKEALGFLPRTKLEYYAENNRIYLHEENGEPCGYLIRGPWKPRTKIYQLAVAADARRIEHGIELVAQMLAEATLQQVCELTCWCAADLEANLFWKAIGFKQSKQRAGGRARRRVHNLYLLAVPPIHTLF